MCVCAQFEQYRNEIFTYSSENFLLYSRLDIQDWPNIEYYSLTKTRMNFYSLILFRLSWEMERSLVYFLWLKRWS